MKVPDLESLISEHELKLQDDKYKYVQELLSIHVFLRYYYEPSIDIETLYKDALPRETDATNAAVLELILHAYMFQDKKEIVYLPAPASDFESMYGFQKVVTYYNTTDLKQTVMRLLEEAGKDAGA